MLTSPLERPLHFLGIEIVVIACFALTLRHAVVRYRQGERWHLFQWLVIFAYGVLMELIAFNYIQNYEHARFTVQLYRGLLPLYVPCVYLVLHYAGIEAVQRLHLGWLPEALLVGFAICLLDVPFDVVGVRAGWWRWTGADPNTAYRWLGVPVTSYYWYMLFGACFAALCRGLRRVMERRSLATFLAAAPLVGLAIIVTGTLAFLPFHALKAAGVAEGTIVAAHMAGCTALALLVRAPDARPLAPTLRAISLALGAWHLTVLAILWRTGTSAHPVTPTVLVTVLAGAAGAIAIAWGLPLRARLAEPAPAE